MGDDGSRTVPISKIRKRVRARWTGEGAVFRGGPSDEVQITLDGKAEKGPSPMDTLLLGLAACMGADIVSILEKARVPVESFEVSARGERAEEHPRRYLEIEVVYTIKGPGPEHQAKLDRAVALSREKYCSFTHSLHPDIAMDVRIERV
jgi:putative redox protein